MPRMFRLFTLVILMSKRASARVVATYNVSVVVKSDKDTLVATPTVKQLADYIRDGVQSRHRDTSVTAYVTRTDR